MVQRQIEHFLLANEECLQKTKNKHKYLKQQHRKTIDLQVPDSVHLVVHDMYRDEDKMTNHVYSSEIQNFQQT